MNLKPGSIDISHAAEDLGLSLSTVEAGQMATYLGLLVTYNQRMNLVGKADWRTIFDTLIIDSIHLAGFVRELGLPAESLALDLGAGAGLPGIPLRILWDSGGYWLVEVRQKRCSFMRTALARLGLSGTHVFEGRAEHALDHIAAQCDCDTVCPSHADLVLSRAFMPVDKLLPFVAPMLKKEGSLVILSNEMPPDAGAFDDEWSLGRVMEYDAAGTKRYFWEMIFR